MSDEVTDADLIDLTYLPFTREEVLERFAPVAGAGQIDRWLTHYLDSTANHRSFIAANAGADAPISDLTLIRRGRQIEKDERFWVVAALMAIFQSAEARIDEFSALLTKCFGMKPPVADFDSWRDALGRDLQLYFEVNLASPKNYRVELQKHLEDHLLDIPYIREAALTRGERLEGATKVDAILIAKDTGFNVLFEAKVLSDTSCQIEFDARRNQIARNIDVMLEKPGPRVLPPMNLRDPAKSCFVLLTPDLFRRNPESRLYGWLMRDYKRDSELLQRHLPHRTPDELATVPSRLGWLTWEDCNDVHVGACPWMASATNGPA